MASLLAEWIITAPGGEDVRLQIAYFDRRHAPVATDVGPVLDLPGVIAGKVIALASRAAERDYIDTAAALGRGYSVAQLISLARELDPGLDDRDFADAGDRLDQMTDRAFARYGLTAGRCRAEAAVRELAPDLTGGERHIAAGRAVPLPSAVASADGGDGALDLAPVDVQGAGYAALAVTGAVPGPDRLLQVRTCRQGRRLVRVGAPGWG